MGIWTYLVEDYRESRELALCFSGMRLDSAAGAELLTHIGAHPLNIDARLAAIGYCNATNRNADPLVLWLIERMPDASIEHFWMIGEESVAAAESLWRSAFEKYKTARVFENAARSTFEVDPEFSEQSYLEGEKASELDTAWFCRKAAFYEVQMMCKAAQREHFANKALDSILQAIELETKPARRNWLLWTAREYARATNDHERIRLLREADGAWKGKGRDEDRQRQLTVLGLVALARGDEKRATRLLNESSLHLQAGISPSLALLRGLTHTNASEPVMSFLRACLDANVAEGEQIATWALELESGIMPSLVLGTERPTSAP